MDIKAVRAFVRLATDLSFTKAALGLNVTQPQLSLRIKSFEDRLGFRLFNRSSRSVSLTQQGQRLLTACRNAIDSVDELETLAEVIRTNSDEVVRIGALDMFRPLWRPVVMKFMRDNASTCLEISMFTGGHQAAIDQLDEQLDGAFILHLEGDALPGELEALEISRQPIGVLVSSNSSLAGRGILSVSDLQRSRVALFRRELMPTMYDEIKQMLDRTEVSIVRLPEPTEEGMVHFALETGSLVLCGKWWERAADAPANVVHLPLTEVMHKLSLLFVRRRRPATRPASALWAQMARHAHYSREEIVL